MSTNSSVIFYAEEEILRYETFEARMGGSELSPKMIILSELSPVEAEIKFICVRIESRSNGGRNLEISELSPALAEENAQRTGNHDVIKS